MQTIKPRATRSLFIGSICLFVVSLIFSGANVLTVLSAPLQVTVSSNIGFEGYLVDDSGAPVDDGDYDLAFKLWDAASSGSQIGSTENQDDVLVNDGLYAVVLTSFSANNFSGNRWLGVTATNGPTTVNGGSEITPRTRITSVPFALNAQTANNAEAVPWSGVSTKPAGFADGVDNDSLGSLSCSTNQIAKWNGSAWACQADNSTTYSAGTGVDITANSVSVASSYRLPQSCSTSQITKWNGSAWTCQADSGVTGSGTNGQVATWNSSSSVTGSSGLTVSGSNLTVAGGMNVGSGTGAGTGDLVYSSALKTYKNSTAYTAYAYVPLMTPLTSTSWDGDARSDTSSTLLDLALVFGLPANVKAIVVRMFVRDSAAWGTNNLFFAIGGNATNAACVVRTFGGDVFTESVGAVCPTDGNSKVYYWVEASGASTIDVSLQLYGYFL